MRKAADTADIDQKQIIADLRLASAEITGLYASS